MSMISYAQNQEDVLLSRAFPSGKDGFYIDVGANDPVVDSVTKHFYDRGWRGINIEPGTGPYERLIADRKNDINLNIGLSNCEKTAELIEFPSNSCLSTLSPDMANVWGQQGLETIKRALPVRTLAQVCEDYVDRPIDFLKIDVEGHEREVIEGGDWSRWRPRVILVEATWPQQWEHLILAADYLFVIFDGLNRYYVPREDSRLLAALSTPVNPSDDYIPYHYHRKIEDYIRTVDNLSNSLGLSQKVNDELSTRLDAFNNLGPNAIDVAHRLHRMAVRYPRLSSVVKRIARIGA
jgi:FkbM family methyltransferase